MKRSSSYKNKVAITTTSFAEYDKKPLEILKENGVEVVSNKYKRKLSGDELVELCGECIGIIAGTETLGRKVLAGLPRLKVISRCGTGLENVDLVATHELNIKVYNTPDAPTLAVSELTISLILSLLRKTGQMDRALRSGVWKKEMGNLLSGKGVGIIGLGRIGNKVAELLKGFGCKIAYYDPLVQKDDLGLQKMPLKELLAWADILTIHATVKGPIIDKKEFEMMKPGAFLINTSRGEAVNEDALYQALEKGSLAGAALDVFQKEPYTGPLTKLDNVIITPHIGSYARESRIHMEIEAVKNLVEGIRSE